MLDETLDTTYRRNEGQEQLDLFPEEDGQVKLRTVFVRYVTAVVLAVIILFGAFAAFAQQTPVLQVGKTYYLKNIPLCNEMKQFEDILDTHQREGTFAAARERWKLYSNQTNAIGDPVCGNLLVPAAVTIVAVRKVYRDLPFPKKTVTVSVAEVVVNNNFTMYAMISLPIVEGEAA